MAQLDYLMIGHITQDLTPEGPRLGGTAAYAAQTARAFGLHVGLVTSARAGEPLLDDPALADITITNQAAPETTTFTNIYAGDHHERRTQKLSARAHHLTLEHVPDAWRDTPLIHLGPIAAETDPELVHAFPGAFIGLTPQGWLRSPDPQGVVQRCEWPQAAAALPYATATVLSPEDLQYKQRLIKAYIRMAPLLVLTHQHYGADIYQRGDMTHVDTRAVQSVDPTGAGDIFAASFFIWLMQHPDDPLGAMRLANYIATTSVTRAGLASAPTSEEVVEAKAVLGLDE